MLSKLHEKPYYYLLIIYIKVFETIVVLTYKLRDVYVSKSEISPAEFCGLVYFTFYSGNGFKNSPKHVTFVSLV